MDHPLTRDLVMIGGGHTHALVLRAWGMNPVPGVQLTLINPGATAPYSGMLPGMVAGHYQQQDLEIDLVRLARFAGARLIFGRASGMDRAAKTITVQGRPPVAYDVVSVDIGITSELPMLEGFQAHAVPAKPLGTFAFRWEGFVAAAREGVSDPSVVVIGAGVAGVELALAARHRLTQEGLQSRVTLVESGPSPLRDIGDGARRALMAQLVAQGVSVLCDARVERVIEDGVVLASGQMLHSGLTIGAAGARPQGWLGDTGLQLSDGFLDIGPDLSVLNDDAIYAVGDCAHMTHAPRPKAGVYAVRQAPVLAHNLRADLTGGVRKSYSPQKDYLKLISTGHKHAVADKLGLRLEADWLWRWKDRIDQTFMTQFRDLPDMPSAPVPAGAALGVADMMAGKQPLCGGCAAKPAAPVLHAALVGVSASGDDAALLRVGGADLALTTDHFRAFWADPVLLTRIAAVHAMGDIWAMGGTPQAALAQITLPEMSDRLHQRVLREITQSAVDTLASSGVQLVGGHTALGAELGVGFTVTGAFDRAPIGLGGARPGDALILTKPLGTGLIFAAEMQKRAAGRDVSLALQSMANPSGPASRILAPVARAMTDVTGYGCIGHLLTILRASRCGAVLETNAFRFLDGAMQLADQGIRSSAHAANVVQLTGVSGLDPASALAALLVDPQTAGGLLAAVPHDQVDHVLAELPTSMLIGQITDGDPQITVT